ncbi:MAG: hypothetical protein ABIR28_12330, partial [Vicinamibacteria bacterium]
MLLDILDDVFLLDFSLKAAQGALDCLAFLQPDLGQETVSSNNVLLRRSASNPNNETPGKSALQSKPQGTHG